MTNVLPFKQKHAPDTGSQREGFSTAAETKYPSTQAEARLRVGNDDSSKAQEISIEQLYPLSDASTAELATALRLLAEALHHLEVAVSAQDDQDVMGADDAICHVEILMPELFCCRALGDSYGVVVGTVMSALRNRGGEPLTTLQVRTLWLTLKTLRSHPFMNYEKALDLVESVEQSGMNIEPQGFDSLVEWIANE